MIRRGTGELLYVQLANLLRRDITAGKYPPGGTIPSEDRLAEEYGISLNTVRRGIAILRAENLLDVRPGYGTTVVIPDDEADLPRRPIARGVTMLVRPATAEEQDTLGIPPGGRVLVVRLGARTTVLPAEGVLFTTA